MGESKAALEWGDSTLLHHAIEVLMECCWPIAVVARDEAQELPPLHTECELIYDSQTGEGPLVGIASGLAFMAGQAVANQCDTVIALSCDTPYVDASVIRWLVSKLGDAEGAVPEFEGHKHPACAIYRTSLLPALEARIASGERRARAITELDGVVTIPEQDVRAFDPAGRFLANLNSPDDYKSARDKP